MIFVKSNILVREIPFATRPNDVEVIFLELIMRKKKWLLLGGYNPKKEYTSYFLRHVSDHLDRIMASYDNMLILGYFPDFC